MARRPVFWAQRDFSGGMVYRHSQGRLQPNEVQWLENFEINELNYAIQRGGFLRLNASALPGPIQGVYCHQDQAGALHLIVVCGGAVYAMAFDGSTTTLVSGLSAATSTRVQFVPSGNLLILLNGVDAPQKYDPTAGTVTPLGGSPPVAAAGAMYFQHLFLTGVPGEPLRVYHSETGDIEDGYAAKNHFFDVAVGDTSENLAFVALDNELILGKRRSITAIRGYDPRDFSQPQNRAAYTNERGVLGRFAFVEVAGVPWFISDDGIYSIQGPFVTPEQSWAVHGIFGELRSSKTGSIGLRRLSGDQALFLVPRLEEPGSTGHDAALVAHPGRGRGGLAAWSIFTFPGVGRVTSAATTRGGPDGDARGEMIFLGTEDGYVYWRVQNDVDGVGFAYLDHTTPISARLLTDNIDFGTPQTVHLVREIGAAFEVEDALHVDVALAGRGSRRSFSFSHDGASFILGVSLTGDVLGGKILWHDRMLTAEKAHEHQIEVRSEAGEACRVAGLFAKGFVYGRRQAPVSWPAVP